MPGYRITVTVYDPGKQLAVSAWPLEAGSCSRDVAGFPNPAPGYPFISHSGGAATERPRRGRRCRIR